MRKLMLVVAFIILLGGAVYVLMPNPLEAADSQQAATPIAADTTGVSYISIRPSASSSVETDVLRLDNNGSAKLTSDYHTDEAPIVEEGIWSESDVVTSTESVSNTVTVTLTSKDGVNYDDPVVITFQKEGDTLTTVGAEDLYGEDGLSLRLASVVAETISKSLVTLDLEAGFPLDPTFVSVNGGGEVDVSLLDEACTGFVNVDPVVTVEWSGQTDFVRAFYVSDSDSSLVVVTPDGSVLCSDDTSELLLDPTIQIDNPITGTYRIWIGSVAESQLIPGVLVLTTDPTITLPEFDLGSFVTRPKFGMAPVPPAEVDATNVVTAIQAYKANVPAITASSEAVTASVSAVGDIPVFQLIGSNENCSGLIGAQPSYVFSWTGPGDQFELYFEGTGDSSLMVYGAGGEVVACNDDAAPGSNVNPSLLIEEPLDGVYGVWVGRLDPSEVLSGTLTLSTDPEAEPAVLSPDDAE